MLGSLPAVVLRGMVSPRVAIKPFELTRHGLVVETDAVQRLEGSLDLSLFAGPHTLVLLRRRGKMAAPVVAMSVEGVLPSDVPLKAAQAVRVAVGHSGDDVSLALPTLGLTSPCLHHDPANRVIDEIVILVVIIHVLIIVDWHEVVFVLIWQVVIVFLVLLALARQVILVDGLELGLVDIVVAIVLILVLVIIVIIIFVLHVVIPALAALTIALRAIFLILVALVSLGRLLHRCRLHLGGLCLQWHRLLRRLH